MVGRDKRTEDMAGYRQITDWERESEVFRKERLIARNNQAVRQIDSEPNAPDFIANKTAKKKSAKKTKIE